MVNIAFNLQIVVCHSVSPLVPWVPIIKSVSQSVGRSVNLSVCHSASNASVSQSEFLVNLAANQSVRR